MHFKTLITSLFAIAILAPSNANAQEKFQIPDVNPSRFNSNQSNSLPGFEPVDESNIRSKPIEVNDLRGGFNRPSANQTNLTERPFDKQPLPPQPRSFDQNQARDNSTSNQSQNPLKLLNPQRMAPEFNRSNGGNLPPIQSNMQQQNSPIRKSFLADESVKPNQANVTPNISTFADDNSQLVPATYTSPQMQGGQSNPDSTPAAGKSKDSILNLYDVSSSNRPLPGVPVTLSDMMKSTPVKYRMAMVRQYWETYFDWATLQNRTYFANWLNQVPNPRTRAEQMILQTAKSMAQNDVTAAEIQLSKSQSKLHQLSSFDTQDLLPLPLNQPVVTKYNSHYEWYASRNRLPSKLKGVNEVLPRTFKLISQRAQTVSQAEVARNQSRQAFASGQIPLGDLIESGRAWRASLQGFVGTVVNYNHVIGDYALTITSPQKPIDDVVAMLVAKPKSVNEVAQRNSILLRQTGQQPVQQNLASTAFNSAPIQAEQNRGFSQGNTNQSTSRIASNTGFTGSNTGGNSIIRNNSQVRPQNSTLLPAQPNQNQPSNAQQNAIQNSGDSNGFAAGNSQSQGNAFNRLNNRVQGGNGNSFNRSNSLPVGSNNSSQPSSGGGAFGGG